MQQRSQKEKCICAVKCRLFLLKQLLPVLFIAASTVQPVFCETVQDTSMVVTAPVAVTQNNKRQFEQGFKEKYKDSDFVYEIKPEAKSWWQRFKEWFFSWLGRLFSTENPQRTGEIFNTIITIIAICVVLFVVYLIVASIIDKEGTWIFGRSRKKTGVSNTDTEDITQMDFKGLINKTKQDNDYRLAVRYYYLWLLKKMTLKNIIDWNWDKTNSDYLYEIKDSSLKQEFEYLSYVYDYSWYGEFVLDEEAFSKAEKAFIKTFNRL